MQTNHDVVIVGGGLVGASLALALAPKGLDVALVEASTGGAAPAVFDQRNLSFAAATGVALSRLGVLQRLRAPTGPIREIHATRRGDFGRVQLRASDYGRRQFGEVVVASDFGAALEAALAEVPGLVRYRGARFLGFEDADAGPGRRVIRIGTAGPGMACAESHLGARLVVAADGTHSDVRAAAGIGAAMHDYGQVLFVSRVRADRPPDGTAYERLGDDGPTALLPRGDRHYGIVHGVPSADADAVAALDDDAYLRRLQHAFGWRAGRFLATGERSCYPAIQRVADALHADRVVLLGNAAQTIHPIGAQGFNLGLRDALTLAEMLDDAQSASAGASSGASVDPGDAALLSAYALRRGPDREQTLRFADGLARVTGNASPLLRPLRTLGLVALDTLPALQGRLVGSAMGYRAALPRLFRDDVAEGHP